MGKGLSATLIASLLLSGCATQGGTVAGGAGTGAAAGGALGYLLGGKNGAVTGVLVGAALGTAAGLYVADRKKKYASIEDRIDGERRIAAAATNTAYAEISASQAQLTDLNQQIAALTGSRQSRQRKAQQVNTLLASLTRQEQRLTTQRTQLDQTIKNQQAFVDETAGEVRRGDSAKAVQLAAWRADIPKMRAALTALVQQSSNVGAMKMRMQQIRSQYA